MRITWITDCEWMQDAKGRVVSPWASVRYRLLTPASYLHRFGHRCQLLRIDQQVSDKVLRQGLTTDLVVISKIRETHALELGLYAKRLGSRLVVDMCDDKFAESEGTTYRRLCTAADLCIAATPHMAEVIRTETGRDSVVIEDPFEMPEGMPRFAPQSDRLRLLFFGNITNLVPLNEMLPSLVKLGGQMPLSLDIISGPEFGWVGEFAQRMRNFSAKHGKLLSITYTPWTPAAMRDSMQRCDAVIIPSNDEQPKLVKSANRVVESLRSGRFVAAHPLPSYRRFADCVHLDSDVVRGLQWAVNNPQEALARIRLGQQKVARLYDPEIIGRQWEAALVRVVKPQQPPRPHFLSRSKSSTVTPSPTPSPESSE